MKLRARHAGKQEGFTLVEILVAMGLLMIGMTSIAALFAVGLDQLREARVRSESGEAAQRLMEDLRDQLVDQVHMDLNDQVLQSSRGAEVVDRLERSEERLLPGSRDLRYTYVATRIPGRKLQFLAEIRILWRVGGRARDRELRAVFDLSPSLATQSLSNTLEYRVPSGASLEGDHR